MAFRCDHCEDLFDGDTDYLAIISCRFVVNDGSVRTTHEEYVDLCDSCGEEDSFYCDLTDERFLDSKYEYVETTGGDTVCRDAAKALGWTANDDNIYSPPDESQEPKQQENKPMYVDFYWELRDGERHGVLQKDGGGEAKMSTALEQKIYNRIDEAGADKGDPNVVNVYTRLQLIDEGLLSADYVL